MRKMRRKAKGGRGAGKEEEDKAEEQEGQATKEE